MMSNANDKELELTPLPELLYPPSVMMMGEPGAGKTWAITTFMEVGIEVFVLITDPRGEESLLASVADRGLDIDFLHYNYIAQADPDWDTLKDMARKVNLLGYKDLSELKTGIKKQDFQQFFELLDCCANFKCSRTGLEYGAVDSWGADRVFVLDTLSGLNTMAMDCTVGAKPAPHQGEWGTAMNMEERIIKKWCSALKCYFVMNCHLEREPDELGGSPVIMAGALGKKLAPKLPKDFSEVVMTYREGDNFFWTTSRTNVALKARMLPRRDKLAPDYGQLVTSYKERLAAHEATLLTSTATLKKAK